MGVIVREATDGDFATLRPVLQEFVKLSIQKSEYKLYGDPDYLLSYLKGLSEADGATLLVVVDTGDYAGPEPVGFMGLRTHAWGASPRNNFCSENLWYLYPSHGKYIRHLLKFANKWAKDQNCDYLTMSANRLVGSDVKRLERIFVNLGLRPLYQLHIQEIK